MNHKQKVNIIEELIKFMVVTLKLINHINNYILKILKLIMLESQPNDIYALWGKFGKLKEYPIMKLRG